MSIYRYVCVDESVQICMCVDECGYVFGFMCVWMSMFRDECVQFVCVCVDESVCVCR